VRRGTGAVRARRNLRGVTAALAVVLVGGCGSSTSPGTSPPPTQPSITQPSIRQPSITQPASAVGRKPNATVVYVVDGDTIDVTINGAEQRVRLIGVDTPETKKQNTPVECFGREATAFTESLLPAQTPIHLERDVEARDDYGRLLGYVYRSSDGLFVNFELVAQGYANPLTFPPNIAYADQFREAARAAEQADLGLWKACAG
jgi:micrococcal nuclease